MTAAKSEGQRWDEQADGWARFQEGQFRPAFEDALNVVGVGPGTRLLDVGCGSGLLLRLAAERGASVTGLDASAGLLEIARGQLPPSAELHQGDLSQLSYPESSFSVVTSFNALRYAVDPVAAVQGFARVARDGAAVVVGGWGEPERCETTALLFSVLRLLPDTPRWAGAGAVNSPGEVRSVLRRAGLRVAQVHELPCPFVYPGVTAAWQALSATGLLRHAVAQAGEPVVRKLFDDHFQGAERDADGTVRQHNVCEYTVARV